jgi:beta-lactamase regulating signal transducer with metallopeptidase domain
MSAPLNLDHIARISATTMLNCMLEGIAIGLFTWLLLRVVGRRNSSTRFAVWFSALLAIATLPMLGIAASHSASPGRIAFAITVPSSWAFDIFFIWAAIAGVLLLRLGAGLLQLRKLRASYTSIDLASLDSVLRARLQEFQAVRPVALCHSNRISVPTAIGFLKPVVVLPSWTLQELSPTELNAILIHELSHLRRWDDWTNLAQQVLKALLFFHPAVWWIESQLALEREMACDDAVLAETGSPRGYAQCLVAMAEKSFLHRGLALAQAAVNRMRHTSLRVSQILDVNRSRATRVWKPALYSVAAFFVVCLVSFSHAPELVAFQERSPDTAIASATAANPTLTSAASPTSPALATPVAFRTRSAAPPSDSQIRRGRVQSLAHQNSDRRISEAKTPPAPRIAEYQVLQTANSVATQSVAYQVWEFTSPLAARSVSYLVWENANPPQRQSVAYSVGEGTSLLVPHGTANNPGIQPLRRTSTAVPVQTIFVMTQAAQNDIEHWTLCVWRVTVLQSNPVATRIPAKQI